MIPGPAPVTVIQPVLGERRGEPSGLVVEQIVHLDPGRTEDRHLALIAVGLEHRERVAHLCECRGRDLEVERVRLVGDESQRLGHEFLGESYVVGDSEFGDDRCSARVDASSRYTCICHA